MKGQGPLEATIVNNIKQYLRTVPGCFFWKEHGGVYGTAGIPDIICCISGQFVAFEVKRPGNKPTALQSATIQAIQRAGGKAYIVYSIQDVKNIIEHMHLTWRRI